MCTKTLFLLTKPTYFCSVFLQTENQLVTNLDVCIFSSIGWIEKLFSPFKRAESMPSNKGKTQSWSNSAVRQFTVEYQISTTPLHSMLAVQGSYSNQGSYNIHHCSTQHTSYMSFYPRQLLYTSHSNTYQTQIFHSNQGYPYTHLLLHT